MPRGLKPPIGGAGTARLNPCPSTVLPASGRFLHLSGKLDNLPALFGRNPFHAFSEIIRDIELNNFCHSYLCLFF